ncbi:cysteine hydrolase family protein [Sedimenticola sp.]|uniref:cysteine hydrolase family protein n=1 Tax=Sedimenticola sp. TaxID=1940285 RepID=UPI003D141C7F
MNTPKTLLEIAGAPPRSVDWSQAAVILVDFQQEYLNGALNLGPSAKPAIDAANRLAAHAREIGAPVFHVVHHGRAGGATFTPNTPLVDIVPGLSVMEGEPIVIKSMPNAFKDTHLAELIEQTGRRQLIFCGFMSHMCVSTSVRAALDLGYLNFVCSDACATRDLADENGEVIPAATVHKATMAALRDLFATVIRSDAMLP